MKVTKEKLRKAFQRKLSLLPEELHEAVGLYYVYRTVQKQKVAAQQQIKQTVEVADAAVLNAVAPEVVKAVAHEGQRTLLAVLRKYEEDLAKAIASAMRRTRWWEEVAEPAGRGHMSEVLAAGVAYYIGSPSRFPSVTHLWSYAGVSPHKTHKPPRLWSNGKREEAVKFCHRLHHLLVAKWARVHQILTLYRARKKGMPLTYWHVRAQYWINYYTERHPDWNQGHVLNAAARKIAREFLADLYDLWVEYEERYESPVLERDAVATRL